MEFDEELFSVGLGSNPEWEQPTLRIGYTSFITPSRVYDYRLATGELLRASRSRCSAASIRRNTSSTASGRSPTTAPASRSRSCGARGSAATRPRRCCTGTARTRPAWTRRSRWRGSRCSTAAWSSSSPTSAAAARWGGTGTRTARRSPRRTPSPISSRAQGISSPRGGRHRGSWWPTAAVRAVC